MHGRRCLVTGASRGVGAATVRALAEAGHRVALVSRDPDALAVVARQLPGDPVVAAADVADPDALARAVEHAAGQLGGLDVVVSNAGVSRRGAFGSQRPADWRWMTETNLLGPMYLAHAALPHLRTSGAGDFVVVSSMSGRRTIGSDSSVYAATKAGLNAWTDGLRRELGRDGIRVITVSPGLVATTFGSETTDLELRREILARKARTGLSAEDVAAQLVWAISQPRHVRIHDLAVMPTAQES